MSLIKESVMQSLKRAGAQAMRGCEFDFGNQQQPGFKDGEIHLGAKRDLGCLYQNEIVRIYSIMTDEEFEKMKCTFKCEYDPRTMEPFEQQIDNSQFIETENDGHSYLFKLAAKQGLEQGNVVKQDHIQEVALKYQVLSKHTELVGVSKVKSQPQPQQ